MADALKLDYFVLKAVPTQVSRTLGKHSAGLSSPYWGLWGTSDFTPSRSNEMYFAVTPERAEQWKRGAGLRCLSHEFDRTSGHVRCVKSSRPVPAKLIWPRSSGSAQQTVSFTCPRLYPASQAEAVRPRGCTYL